ncbi:MAG: CZB domain-containing protein [Gammaproteobacteria bacterium]|nr:CZB domain-containing protein [Gammaproteobacteria bacterium]MDH5802774.1 CZB domain-containing protein [Gammaproteobacteria bacterium]
MSLIDWLNKKLSGDNSAQLSFKEGEEEFAGLNLKEVLNAHLAWNERLKNYLNNTSDEDLDVHQIAPDNLCVLGKWIYGPGSAQFGKLAEFNELKQTHKKFHLTAGEIVLKHNEGQQHEAATMLKGPFRSLSGHIQLNLVRLYASAN